jgi:hypothetical protein
MPIDPNIALGVRGIEVPNPLNQLAQVSQIQNAQNQNALAQYTLGKAQREDVAANALDALYAKHFNPATGAVDKNALFAELATKNLGSQIPKLQASMAETEGKLATANKTKAEAAIKQTELFKNDLVNVNNPQDAALWLASQYKDPVMGGVVSRVPLDKALQQIPQDPQGFTQWKQKNALGMDKYIERTTVTEADRQRIAQEGQRIGLEGRRVAVMEEENKRAKDPVFQQQMAAAKETGAAIAKGNVAAQQALPSILDNAERQVKLIDQMVGKQEVRDKSGKVIQAASAPHPGFAPAVGAGGWGTLGIPGIARFTPGTDAADFQSFFDEVKGGAFLEAFNVLKGAGAISEEEGKKATTARTRMSLAQSEKAFVDAARDYQDVIRNGVQIMQKKAGNTGTVPVAPAGAAPAAAGGVKFLGFEQ